MRLDSEAFLLIFAAYFLVYSAVPRRPKRVLLVVGSVAVLRDVQSAVRPSSARPGPIHLRGHGPSSPGDLRSAPKRLLWLGVGVNVLTLAFFKAAEPAVKAGAGLLSALGMPHPTHPVSIVVPARRVLLHLAGRQLRRRCPPGSLRAAAQPRVVSRLVHALPAPALRAYRSVLLPRPPNRTRGQRPLGDGEAGLGSVRRGPRQEVHRRQARADGRRRV